MSTNSRGSFWSGNSRVCFTGKDETRAVTLHLSCCGFPAHKAVQVFLEVKIGDRLREQSEAPSPQVATSREFFLHTQDSEPRFCASFDHLEGPGTGTRSIASAAVFILDLQTQNISSNLGSTYRLPYNYGLAKNFLVNYGSTECSRRVWYVRKRCKRRWAGRRSPLRRNGFHPWDFALRLSCAKNWKRP